VVAEAEAAAAAAAAEEASDADDEVPTEEIADVAAPPPG
jgi:hypothetical protein